MVQNGSSGIIRIMFTEPDNHLITEVDPTGARYALEHYRKVIEETDNNEHIMETHVGLYIIPV